MEFEQKLSNNLTLHNTETVSESDDQVVSVAFWFSFYDLAYKAVLHIDDVTGDWPSFVMTEGPSELYDSFVSQLEDEHWGKLVECFGKHQDNHNCNI